MRRIAPDGSDAAGAAMPEGARDGISGIEAVFLDNRGALQRFLRACGGEHAEDLLQDLWLKVSAAPSEPIAEPLAYLYRMAHNLMLDRRRSELRRGRRDQEWTDGW